MEIEETLLSRKIIIETDDPYALALELMDFFSGFGKVVERENRYETDGPTRKIVLNFDLVENIDRVAHSVIEVFTQGETNNVNYLEIEITGKFAAEIENSGFFPASFAEYYLKHLFPRYLKAADEKMKKIDKEIVGFAGSKGKQAKAARGIK